MLCSAAFLKRENVPVYESKIISVVEISRNSWKDQVLSPRNNNPAITHVQMCSTVFDLQEVQVLGVSHCPEGCIQGLQSVNNATERMS